MEKNEDIAVSQPCLLANLIETAPLITAGNYELILDEAPCVVQNFNSTTGVADNLRQYTDAEDIRRLISGGYISVSPETGQVQWTGAHWEQFSELERMCRMGQIYFPRDTMLLCVLPPEFFALFKDVYIFTYHFEGTFLHAYFEKYNIPYEKLSVEKTESGYCLTDYNREKELIFRQQIKDLIQIVGGGNKYPGTALSKNWFKKDQGEKALTLQHSMEYFFRYTAKAKVKEVMWTTLSDFEVKLQCKGYTRTRRLNHEEKTASKMKQEEYRKRLKTFVPCNACATNDYKDRRALAYCANIYPSVDLEAFFTDYGTSFSRDAFAQYILIQWIFRSQLRERKHIILYLPSARMEKLLNAWLDGEDLKTDKLAA